MGLLSGLPHGVVERKGRNELTSLARVDVHLEVLLGDGVQVKQGADELVAELLRDPLPDEDNALPVEAVPQIDPLPISLLGGSVRNARHRHGHLRHLSRLPLPHANAVRARSAPASSQRLLVVVLLLSVGVV